MRKGIFVLGAAFAILAGPPIVGAQGDGGQRRPPGEGGQGRGQGMQRQMGGLNPGAALFKGIELTKEQQEKIDSINAKYGRDMRGARAGRGMEAGEGRMMRGRDGARPSDSARRGDGRSPRPEGVKADSARRVSPPARGSRGDSIRWGLNQDKSKRDSTGSVPHHDGSKADSVRQSPRSLQGFRGPMNEDMEKEILNVLTEPQRVIFKQNQKELAEKMKQMMNDRGGDQRVTPARPNR